MNTEKFVFKVKRDFQPEPDDFSIKRFSCYDFFASTQRFIEHNFEGAIKIEFPERFTGFVNIAPKGFTYFIRVLLSEIYGDSLAQAKIYVSERDVTVSISKVGGLRSYSKLENIAVRSGFSFERDGDTLILKTPLRINQELFIYANDILKLLNYFYEVFLM